MVDFNQPKITEAIFKALTVTKKGNKKIAQKLSDEVVSLLNRRFKSNVDSLCGRYSRYC